MIIPANPIRAEITAGTLLCAGEVTPVFTVVAGGDEEGGSAGFTEPEECAAVISIFSQIKSIDILITIDSLLP
jgi:hypothetical protein